MFKVASQWLFKFDCFLLLLTLDPSRGQSGLVQFGDLFVMASQSHFTPNIRCYTWTRQTLVHFHNVRFIIVVLDWIGLDLIKSNKIRPLPNV